MHYNRIQYAIEYLDVGVADAVQLTERRVPFLPQDLTIYSTYMITINATNLSSTALETGCCFLQQV
jgi:hypothetical protein